MGGYFEMKRMLHMSNRPGAVPDAVHKESKVRHSRERRSETLPEGLRRDFLGLEIWTVGSEQVMKMGSARSWTLTVVEREAAGLAATGAGQRVSSVSDFLRTHQSHSHSSMGKTEGLAAIDGALVK